MRTTTLGATGATVGRIGLGATGTSFGYDPLGRDDATSVTVLRRALDLGVNLIDTEDLYGPYTREGLVGRALAGRRDEAVLVAKAGLTMGEDGLGHDGHPDRLRAAVDACLRRLGTDHVDLYFLRRIDPLVPLEESWGVLAEIVATGKVRAVGLSDAGPAEIRCAQEIHRVDAVEAEMPPVARGSAAGILPCLRERGIAFLPYAPLGRVGPAGSAAVRAVARRRGATAEQVALAWLLAQGEYVVPVPGTKDLRDLAGHAAAADLVLSAAELDAIEALPELDAVPALVGACG
ncbi:aldo/keto reductase [Streptomyces sp. NPDC050504]|uniref:aldo/keto reductase n=1 Tax=Streptomyces sp. NPDC050504 TaxID=3365618 RepID=UPI0037A20C3D